MKSCYEMQRTVEKGRPSEDMNPKTKAAANSADCPPGDFPEKNAGLQTVQFWMHRSLACGRKLDEVIRENQLLKQQIAAEKAENNRIGARKSSDDKKSMAKNLSRSAGIYFCAFNVFLLILCYCLLMVLNTFGWQAGISLGMLILSSCGALFFCGALFNCFRKLSAAAVRTADAEISDEKCPPAHRNI